MPALDTVYRLIVRLVALIIRQTQIKLEEQRYIHHVVEVTRLACPAVVYSYYPPSHADLASIATGPH